jgi:hypothetical protein
MRFGRKISRPSCRCGPEIRAPPDMSEMPTYSGQSGYPDAIIHLFRSGCVLEASNCQRAYTPGIVSSAVVTIDQFDGDDFMAGPKVRDILSRFGPPEITLGDEASDRILIYASRGFTASARFFSDYLRYGAPLDARTISHIEVFPPMSTADYQRTLPRPATLEGRCR